MPAHPVTIETIDVEPALFEPLAREIRNGLEADDAGERSGPLVMLLHRRKADPLSPDEHDALLTAVETAVGKLDRARIDGGALFLVDVGRIGDDPVHSDLPLLADIVQKLASSDVDEDLDVDIVLVDYESEPSADSGSIGETRARSLRDPSVLEDKMATAMAALGDIDPAALNLSAEDVDAMVGDIMERLKKDMPAAFEDNPAR